MSRPAIRGHIPAALIALALAAPLLAGASFGAMRDVAGLFAIDGDRRLYLECRGEGSPTVILEAGYRSPATVWSEDLLQPERPRTMVLDGVAAVTRVCLYERPGTAA